MSDVLTVTVTQDDIDAGKRHQSMFCPIARAVLRMGFAYVGVYSGWLAARADLVLETYDMSARAARFVRAFDDGCLCRCGGGGWNPLTPQTYFPLVRWRRRMRSWTDDWDDTPGEARHTIMADGKLIAYVPCRKKRAGCADETAFIVDALNEEERRKNWRGLNGEAGTFCQFCGNLRGQCWRSELHRAARPLPDVRRLRLARLPAAGLRPA